MSTILKALRRLEEQKSAAAQRPLRDEVVLTPGRTSGTGAVRRRVPSRPSGVNAPHGGR